MSNSDIDLSRPLLQDDELASDEPLLSSGFEEEEERTTKLNTLQSRLRLSWRKHKRRVVLGLSYTAAATLAVLVLLIVIAPKAPNVPDVDVPAVWNKTLAYDPRLEKYESPDDMDTCPPWSPPQLLAGSTSTYTSTVSFTLPPTPDLTFFLSRGSPIAGQFTIHGDRAQGQEITVDVTAEYNDTDKSQEALANTKACFSSLKEDGLWEQGMLLWVDPALSSTDIRDRVRYNISVHLPDIRTFNEFSTDFTNPGSVVAQHIYSLFDIWRPTGFGAVRLNSRDAPIRVDTLTGTEMYVSTTDASVDASFWVNKAAHVQTCNAPIRGMVWAIGHQQNASISTSLRTVNAPIFSALTIASDFSHITLNASIHTTNGNLTVLSPRAMVTPYPSIYLLSASTSNAPANVYLHPEYEGTFDLRTAGVGWGGKAEWVWDDQAGGRDPAGEGRVRRVDWEGGKRERRWKRGRVVWGEEVREERMGGVRVWTTGSDVVVVAQKGRGQ